jgi:hypothetical protein
MLEGMVLVSLLLAPGVMAFAAVVERRLGPSAAGWVAALPVSFSIAVLAVTFDGGAGAARAMALSAAAHVPAQVAFGLVFALVLTRHGLLAGGAAAALAYVAGSIAVAGLPPALAVAVAVPALVLAPRLVGASRPRPGSPRGWPTTAVTCVVASVIVATAVITSRLAGPETAGAVAGFPSVSATLVVAVVRSDGAIAGAHALLGLLRSLPCYLTFCLVAVLTVPTIGVPAVALALVGCVAVGSLAWRHVPLAPVPFSPAAVSERA